MPSVTIHPPAGDADIVRTSIENPLPQLLQTPSGLAILELQGSIHTPEAPQATNKSITGNPSTPVGRLVFPDYDKKEGSESKSWMKRVHLYVGRHQRLTGEVKKLANPMAVIRRRNVTQTEESKEELEIADIVYYKIIFSSRPEPVSG